MTGVKSRLFVTVITCVLLAGLTTPVEAQEAVSNARSTSVSQLPLYSASASHTIASQPAQLVDRTPLTFDDLATSAWSACGISNGNLYCWGSIPGQADDVHAPTRVGNRSDWATVSIGVSHICAITTAGDLYCWGENESYQLGIGEEEGRSEPTLIDSYINIHNYVVAIDFTWVSVSAGSFHTCGVTSNNQIYCWGPAYTLGNDSCTACLYRPYPIRISTANGGHLRNWASVSSGGNHTCAITTTGALYCWGDNSSGQLGIGNNVRQTIPALVSGGPISSVIAGSHTTCAISGGGLTCWGRIPFMANQRSPQLIRNADTDWADVAIGRDRICAIKLSGSLFCMGINHYGALGTDDESSQEDLTAVAGGSTAGWASVMAPYGYNTCGIDRERIAWCWGQNQSGILADGTVESRSTPQKIRHQQIITFSEIPNRTIQDPSTFTVDASSSSGLPVSFAAHGTCSVAGNQVSIIGAGTCAVTAMQEGDNIFAPNLRGVTQEFSVSKVAQVITFGALANKTVLAAPFSVSASASSGLPVSFTSLTENVCNAVGSTITIYDIGACSIVASQSGSEEWSPAETVTRTFTISRVLLLNKTVRFTGPDGTTPIVGAAVTWSSRDGVYQSTSTATTNSSGNIVFKSIPGGAIDFAVSGVVIGDWSGYQEVSGFVGSTTTTVRLASNSYSYFTTTLTVQMPDGSPVVGAAVALQRYEVHGSSENRFCRPYQRYEWLLRDCKFQGVTDAFGRVTFRIIPATLTTDCCGEGVRTWAEVSISDASISYTTEVEVFDNVATAVIEIEQLPVVDMLAVDALVGYAAPRTITAVARDSSGDPIAGQALTLSASVSGATANCTGKKTTATTSSSGLATFKVCPVKTAVWSVDGASIVGSSGVTLTVQATPTAPRSLTATGKTKAVALAWAAPASVNIGAVTDYIVQYRLQGSSTWITFRDGTSTARKATVTGLIKGRVYEFRIAAKNKAGTGTWSSIGLGTAR